MAVMERSTDKSISQAGQLSVNSQYLAKASLHVEDILWASYKPYAATRNARKDELNPGWIYAY